MSIFVHSIGFIDKIWLITFQSFRFLDLLAISQIESLVNAHKYGMRNMAMIFFRINSTEKFYRGFSENIALQLWAQHPFKTKFCCAHRGPQFHYNICSYKSPKYQRPWQTILFEYNSFVKNIPSAFRRRLYSLGSNLSHLTNFTFSWFYTCV